MLAERRTLSRGTDRQFLHIVVDDHSRLACAEVLPSERGRHAVAFLCCAARWYTEHDLAVEQVTTPATALPTSAAAGAQLAANSLLRYLRTRACTPRTNGKAEQMIGTMLGSAAGPAPSPAIPPCAAPGPLPAACTGTTAAGPTLRSAELRPPPAFSTSVVCTARA